MRDLRLRRPLDQTSLPDDLLTLLLLSPAFASAASGPCSGVTGGSCLPVISGSFTYRFDADLGGWTAGGPLSGNGFSGGVGFCCEGATANIGEFPVGTAPSLRFADGTDGSAAFAMVLHGQSLPIGDNGNPVGAAGADVTGAVGPVRGSGIYFGYHSASIFIQYNYELSCPTLPEQCAPLYFARLGNAVIDVESTRPGFLTVVSAKFTWVPEPATLSLFAAGLVGLAMRRKAVAPLHTS